MPLLAVGDGLVHHHVTNPTVEFLIDGVDEMGLDAHVFMLWMGLAAAGGGAGW